MIPAGRVHESHGTPVWRPEGYCVPLRRCSRSSQTPPSHIRRRWSLWPGMRNGDPIPTGATSSAASSSACRPRSSGAGRSNRTTPSPTPTVATAWRTSRRRGLVPPPTSRQRRGSRSTPSTTHAATPSHSQTRFLLITRQQRLTPQWRRMPVRKSTPRWKRPANWTRSRPGWHGPSRRSSASCIWRHWPASRCCRTERATSRPRSSPLHPPRRRARQRIGRAVECRCDPICQRRPRVSRRLPPTHPERATLSAPAPRRVGPSGQVSRGRDRRSGSSRNPTPRTVRR